MRVKGVPADPHVAQVERPDRLYSARKDVNRVIESKDSMRNRSKILLPLFLSATCIYTYLHPKHPLDALNALTPPRFHRIWSDAHGSGPAWGRGSEEMVPVIEALREGRWAGGWEVKDLRKPMAAQAGISSGPAASDVEQNEERHAEVHQSKGAEVWKPEMLLGEVWTKAKPAIEKRDFEAKNVGGLTEEDLGPAMIMLHIFSTPLKESRTRRDLIRRFHPLIAVPEAYRHLVEVKFVLGYPPPYVQSKWNASNVDRGGNIAITEDSEIEDEDPWVWDDGLGLEGSDNPSAGPRDQEGWDDEATLEAEQVEHGDLIRLERLKGGENMVEGKTWEWIRHVGEEGGREAWWVVKCDDDTLPILPNFLPWLTTLDPSVPTVFGKPLVHRQYNTFFFEGMMYGMSWGVVKTLATANVTREDIEFRQMEDVRMSELLLNLPTMPQDAPAPRRPFPFQLRDVQGPYAHKRPKKVVAPGETELPAIHTPPPDPRTGLVRIDVSHYFGQRTNPWMYGGTRAFAWHEYKTEAEYIGVWKRAVEELRDVGRNWRWDPPSWMRVVARDERTE